MKPITCAFAFAVALGGLHVCGIANAQEPTEVPSEAVHELVFRPSGISEARDLVFRPGDTATKQDLVFRPRDTSNAREADGPSSFARDAQIIYAIEESLSTRDERTGVREHYA